MKRCSLEMPPYDWGCESLPVAELLGESAPQPRL
jgi:hypothetical protein